MTDKELTTTKEHQISNVLMQSIEGGQLQPEQLKMVLDAQERILDRQAKQDFAIAMSACQAEMPTVLKNAKNAQTHSTYEKLDQLNNTIKPCYTSHGFAVSFNSFPASVDGYIAMKATVSHSSGWSEEHTMELPPDSMGIKGSVNKTPVHAVSSTRSYLRRYLLREIFNITTSEDIDDDAQEGVQLMHGKMDTKPLDSSRIVMAADFFKSKIDEDQIELTFDIVQKAFDKLFNDERQGVFALLDKHGKPEGSRKKYTTILNEYLDYVPAEPEVPNV